MGRYGWRGVGQKVATALATYAGKKAINAFPYGYGKKWNVGHHFVPKWINKSNRQVVLYKPRKKNMPRYKRRRKTRSYRLKGPQRGRFRRAGNYGRYNRGPSSEVKYHDFATIDASISQAGSIWPSINLIAQGTDEDERIGRKCTIRSIGWRFNFRLTEQTDVTRGDETLRIILYLDKQCNGAAATALEILSADDYQSFNNLTNSSRFRKLMDRTISMNIQAQSGDGTTSDQAPFGMDGSFYKKCNIPLEFSSTTGAITEIRSNNVGILLISRRGAVAALDGIIRVRFTG